MANPWNGLRLVERAEVFERTKTRAREGIFQLPPVVGESVLFLGCLDEIVAVDRRSLSILWQLHVADLRPLLLWSQHELLVGGRERSGLLDVRTSELIWTIDYAFARERWRESIVLTVRNGFRLLEAKTGQILKELGVLPPRPSGAYICGDLVVFDSEETGDPVRCMTLPSGEIVWERNIYREMWERCGVEARTINIVSGTDGQHFIGSLGRGDLAQVIFCSLEDGHTLWNVGIEVPHGPHVVDGKLPVLADHRFVVIDEATGELLCDRTYDSLWGLYYPSKGCIYRDKIAFVSESGHVPVFDLNDGRLVWLGRYEMTFQGSVEVDGRLLVVAADGRLWVFEGRGSA